MDEKEKQRRLKISNTLKGKIPKNLSLLHTLERTEIWRKRIGLGHKGLRHTEEVKRKISDAKRNPLRPLYKAVRECYKSRDWRISIFGRDRYTCVFCHKKGGNLNADHFPKRFVDLLKKNKITNIDEALNCAELWDIKNGRTLCGDCHKQTETFGNKFRG